MKNYLTEKLHYLKTNFICKDETELEALNNKQIITGLLDKQSQLILEQLSQLNNYLYRHNPLDFKTIKACQSKEELLQYIGQTFNNNINHIQSLTQNNERAVPHNVLFFHANLFTAILGNLSQHYSCFAIVRNPVDVLFYWRTLNNNLTKGYAPMAEKFDPLLCLQLHAIKSSTRRQMHLIDWSFKQYKLYLTPEHIIRFEDIISSNGAALSIIHPQEHLSTESGKTMSKELSITNNIDQKTLEQLIGAFKKDKNYRCWQNFYSEKEIESRFCELKQEIY